MVGTSRGEDLGSATIRARGTAAGMIAGVVASQLAGHPGIAVAAAVLVTSYLAMGCGWGQATARIGASLAAVTALAHSQDAIEYTFMRMGNTTIGIVAGLVVSYLVIGADHEALRDHATQVGIECIDAFSAALASARARPTGPSVPPSP